MPWMNQKSVVPEFRRETGGRRDRDMGLIPDKARGMIGASDPPMPACRQRNQLSVF